jgi:hypothetical protein
MVALALATIISLMISRVGTQAQQVYETTKTRVELYQKFRFAIGDMKSQIENWRLTSDMEFFVDSQGNRNGHWDEGEEIKKPNNLDGGFRTKDYDEAACIIERTYEYQPPGGGPTEVHENFSIYFKAPVLLGGTQRMANVEYYLSDPSQGDGARVGEIVEGEAFKSLSLVKVVRWINDSKDDFFKTEREVLKKTVELCQNVTDLRFEYYYDNEYDNRPGAFLTPDKEKSGELVKSEFKIKALKGGNGYVKEFMYGGFRGFLSGEADPARREPATGEMVSVRFKVGSAEAGINFSELGFGDKIYIWRDTGQGQFPEGEYTVNRKITGALEFQEPLSSELWEGKQSGLRFKAGYIPSAIRITLRVLDDKGFKPRVVQTVVHPFRKKS